MLGDIEEAVKLIETRSPARSSCMSPSSSTLASGRPILSGISTPAPAGARRGVGLGVGDDLRAARGGASSCKGVVVSVCACGRGPENLAVRCDRYRIGAVDAGSERIARTRIGEAGDGLYPTGEEIREKGIESRARSPGGGKFGWQRALQWRCRQTRAGCAARLAGGEDIPIAVRDRTATARQRSYEAADIASRAPSLHGRYPASTLLRTLSPSIDFPAAIVRGLCAELPPVKAPSCTAISASS